MTVPGKDHQVVGVSKDGDGTAMMFQWTTGEGFCFGNAFANYQFDSEVKQDSTEGTSLFDARVDRYGRSLAQRSNNFCGCTGVYVTNHGYQIRWKAHVGEGGQQRRVLDTAKSVTDVQPGKTERAKLTTCIVDYGLKQKGMFIASFTGSGTLLLLGEEVVVNGKGCHTFCNYGHQELVKAGHEGNGAEVTCIRGRVLLVYQDCGSCFPGGRDIFRKETMAKHLRKDLATWIKEA